MNKRTHASNIPPGTEGFSLIEILVAVSILAVVMVMLYSSFSVSHDAVTSVDDSLLKLQESRRTLDMLKREIESAFYAQGRDQSFFKLDDRDFYGRQASEISFTAFSPLAPGLMHIKYFFDEHNGSMVLQKKAVSSYGASQDIAGVILLDDVESFVIEAKYHDQWVKTWDSDAAGGFPDELKISIAMKLESQQGVITLSDTARTKIGKRL
jgi:general secretion pathway protein J